MTDYKYNEFNRFYDYAYKAWSAYYAEAQRDMRSYAGDNWTQKERQKLARQGRHALELNKQRRVINLFGGVWRENLKSVVASPQEAQDDIAADQFSDGLIWQFHKGNFYENFNACFDHHLVTGMGLVGFSLDLSDDQVFGDLKAWWRPFNSILLDPYFTRRDLSDCDQASTRDILSKEKVKSLLPWIEPEIIDGLPTGIRDNKYQYMGAYRDINASTVSSTLVTYDQYWRSITRSAKYIVNVRTGEQIEYDPEKTDERELFARLEALNADLPVKKFVLSEGVKKSVELNIIVGGETLYCGPDPTGLDEFPFVPMIAFFEPLIDSYQLKVQGIIRSTRDAQVLYNKRNSQFVDIMESKINTGYMINKGAVLDEDMLLQSGQSKIIVADDGRSIDEIREINPPDIPSSYLAYGQMLDKDIMEIPGMSEELLGISSSGDSQVSGALAMIRASNGLRANRQLFDNAEQALLALGRKVGKAMALNYGEGKWERILGDEQLAPEIKDGSFEKFDITLKQAPLTTTQQDAYYSELLQLQKMGAPIPWSEILRVAPMQGKRDLLRIIEQNEQAAQAAQEAQQAERQEIQKLAQAREALELSRAQASIAEVESKQALNEERRASAELDRAKAVKELTEADLDRIEKVLQLMKTLKNLEENQDGRRQNEGAS